MNSAGPRRSDITLAPLNQPLRTVPAAPPDPIRLGEVLAASGYFADARDAAKAAVKVMAGLELGFGPIAAMTGVHIIEGKPSVGANLLAALVKRSPHYSYRLIELTDDRCSIQFYERDGGEWTAVEPVSVFTMDDARRAGVAGKANWQRYPRNMLFARAISNGVTFHCADLLGGTPIYTPDELGADVDAHGDALPPAPALPAATAPSGGVPADADELRAILKAASERAVNSVDLANIILATAGQPPRDFADLAAADRWVDTALARLPQSLVEGVLSRIGQVAVPEPLPADVAR